MSIQVRRAKITDSVAAIATVRASISRLCTADHQDDPATLSAWLGNKTADNFGTWIANPDNFCVVAVSGEAIAGVGLLHLKRRGPALLSLARLPATGHGTGPLSGAGSKGGSVGVGSVAPGQYRSCPSIL